MKKISKLLVGILFSALVVAPSYAGELTVTGGATATYAIGGDNPGAGKSLGISNELDFSACRRTRQRIHLELPSSIRRRIYCE